MFTSENQDIKNITRKLAPKEYLCGIEFRQTYYFCWATWNR